mgnify:FL=1
MANRTVLITGASRGLGRALSEEFANQKDHLILVARSGSELATLAESLASKGVQITPFICDLTIPEDLQRLADMVADHGQLDVLINSAGLGFYKPFLEHTPEEHDQILDLNVRALIHLTHLLVPLMTGNQSGHIVNISSDVGVNPIANMAVYSASKFAVRGFTLSLAKELRPLGIKTSLINPGIIDTAFNNSQEGSKEPEWSLQPKDLAGLISQVVNQPGYQLVDELTVHPLGQDY